MSELKKKRLARKIISLVLSVMICVSFFPAGVFADAEDNTSEPDGTVVTLTEEAEEDVLSEDAEPEAVTEPEAVIEPEAVTEETSEETTGETSEETPEDVAPAPKTSKSLKVSGHSLKFKKPVLTETNLSKKEAPARTWIKAARKNIKVNWTKPAKTSTISGFIILRKAGKEKVYTEIGRTGNGVYTFTDKKASKRNTVYTYTVVAFAKVDGKTRISPCASWAAGVTSNSKQKNSYKASINKTTANLQVGSKVTLKIKHDKTKNYLKIKSFRWHSDNTAVAKVSKGTVTAVAPGTTTIRGRIASGREYTCKVTVVGAFKPAKPSIERDYSTEKSIGIMWDKVKYATSYDIYCSKNNADNYELIANVTGTAYLHEGLEKGQLYSYIVRARNDNKGYAAQSDRSNALDLKAVKTPRKTVVSGFPSKKSVKARSTCEFTIKVTAPDSRTATLQEYKDKKWVDTKTKIKLPAGIEKESVTVTLPDSWWKKDKTKWRLVFPKSGGATKLTTGAMTLTTKRYYQNPSKYVQITNKISKHGLSYYTAPVLVDNMSTKKDHIEAMIKTARKYLGDPYVVCQSRAPGKGVDCSGLVMQACYGSGVDLWPSNPYRHRTPAYEWESRNIAKHSNLKTVPYKDRKRGDLIFYANSSGVVIHVAIYLGGNKIIHSALSGVHITGMKYPYGHVCKVKRIFN